MSYVGNTALSPQIQERILNTFEQTRGLAEEGNRQEALLGCDFILRLDPLFEPARRLQERLNEGEGPVAVGDLTGDEAPAVAEGSAPDTEAPPPEVSADIGELVAETPEDVPLVGDIPVEVTPPDLEVPKLEVPDLEVPDLEVTDLEVTDLELSVEETPIEISADEAPPVAAAPADEMPLEVSPPQDDAVDLIEDLPAESVEDAPVVADLATRMAMLLEQRNFQDLMSLAMANQDRITGDPDLQQMVGLATERMEAEPYVRNFLESAQTAKEKADLESAKSHLEKARELDPSHPDIPRLEADLEAASRVEPPVSFEPSASLDPSASLESPPMVEVPLEDVPPLIEPDAEHDGLEEVDEFFASVEVPAAEAAAADDPVAEPEPDLEVETSPEKPTPVPTLDAEPAARLDSESEQRIDELLGEGQDSFEDGQYQTAIDAWSRIFLIDIDHVEASRRIELARKLKAEVERQTEEVFHEGITSLESGDEEKAKEAFNNVLEMQPNHMGARDYLDKIESGDLSAARSAALPELAPVEGPALDAGAAEPDLAGPADITPTPTPAPSVLEDFPETEPEPVPKPAPPKRSFALIGTGVLILVLVIGWFVWSNWSRFFPTSGPADDAATTQPRADPVERARELHEAGNTAMAINVLRRLPPGNDQYAEAQALIASWEAGDQPEEVPSDEPSEEVLAQRQELLTRAERAMSRGENLLALNLFDQAVGIGELSAEEEAVKTRATVALALLDEELDLFDQGDWEYALPNLWRMHDANPANPDVLRLMVDSYYNLGLRDLQRGDAKSALEKFEEAQELADGDEDLDRLAQFAAAYAQRPSDMLYRIFVKYQRFR